MATFEEAFEGTVGETVGKVAEVAGGVSREESGETLTVVVEDKDGVPLIAIDSSGRTQAYLNKSSIKQLRKEGAATSENIGCRSFNCRIVEEGFAASVSAEAGTYDVIKRPTLPTIANETGRILIPICGGQSNAGGSSSGHVIESAIFPHHALTFSSGNLISGPDLKEPADISGITSLDDSKSSGQTMVTTAAWSYVAAAAEGGRPIDSMFTFSVTEGGQPLDQFLLGTNNFSNLIAAIESAVNSLNKYEKELFIPCYTFAQGESGGTDYYNNLGAYKSDVISGIKAAAGQELDPEFVLFQINSTDETSTWNGVETHQYNFAKANAANGVTLAGPMYFTPLKDTIHASAEGRCMIGDVLADVYRTIIAGEKFTPLWPISLVLSGNIITVVFNVPAGDLEFDQDWITGVANYGFTYIDDSSSANISSVAITASDTIEITLDAPPTGSNPKLQYAMNVDNTDDVWASGRGQLMSKTSTKSKFHEMGVSIPEHVRHYCVRFQEAL